MHRINFNPYETPVLPLYPAVPTELPQMASAVFPSVPDTEPGSDEDDIFMTLKPPQRDKKKMALLEM